MKKQTLFVAGEGGYAGYRIPAAIALPGNRVVVFCEGRLGGLSDYGTIHILARVSTDGGETFGRVFLVAADGENTVGNPCPVYDRETGVLHLLLNGNLKDGGEAEILAGNAPRRVLSTCSGDGGATWLPLRDLTGEAKATNWTWHAMGPGHGLQLKTGRLLMPCNHALTRAADPRVRYVSHAMYSDDHGKTWKIGADVGPDTNECSLAELPDGRVYINMRSYRGEGCRASAISSDGGETWSEISSERLLPDPVCQGSVLTVGERLLFTNPASALRRENLTLKQSRDLGKTWSAAAVIHPGPAAYSDLAALPGGRVGCAYECGHGTDASAAYQQIQWAVFEKTMGEEFS